MLKRLESYFNIGNSYYGLEVFTREENTHYQLIHIKKSKEELVILSEQYFNDDVKLLGFLDKKIPIFLSFNTADVLDKILLNKTGADEKDLLSNAYPNLDFERFYYNVTPYNNQNYLAIVEKEKANGLLLHLKKQGFYIVNFHLGLATLPNALQFAKEELLKTNRSEITVADGKLSVSPREDSSVILYDINGLEIKSSSLLGFSNILYALIPTAEIQTNYTDFTKSLTANFKFERRFQLLLWPIIIGFLVILLSNFFFFDFYSKKMEAYSQTTSANEISKKKLIQLNKSVLDKEKRVESIVTNSGSSATYLMDAIAKSIPATILLDELTFQPLLKPIRNAKTIALEEGIILIKGKTSNAEAFSDWIALLEGLSWIGLVETAEYAYHNKASSTFTLKISINGA